MDIPYKYYKYIIVLPALFMVFITVIIYLDAQDQATEKGREYSAWTIEVNDYQKVYLSWDNQMFCGEWRVPIREHLADNYCILSNGMELQPLSWTTGPDSLIYEEFMDAVVDTMRTIAERNGYVSSYEVRW